MAAATSKKDNEFKPVFFDTGEHENVSLFGLTLRPSSENSLTTSVSQEHVSVCVGGGGREGRGASPFRRSY